MPTAYAVGPLEQALGYKFKDRKLIIEALTHRSHFHEQGDSPHNERLELLGDAVMDLCVTESLMRRCPAMSEGDLSKMRSQLVSESSLAKVAVELKIGEVVRLGRGEELSGGRRRESLLADTFEAVLAAIYLDAGLEEARRVTLMALDHVASWNLLPWDQTTQNLLRRDYKSRLQELCQGASLGAPIYKCLETRGPDHQRRFVMALFIKEFEMGRAEAPTKKEATQNAARNLLESRSQEGELIQLLKNRIHRFEKGKSSKASKTKNSSASSKKNTRSSTDKTATATTRVAQETL